MTRRYFKASHEGVTVFRASETRAYASATWERNRERVWNISFSAKPRTFHPAVEIDKAEYERLAALRDARIEARRKAIEAAGGEVYRRRTPAPQDAWVFE